MIHHLRIQNFRSVRDIELDLGALNIVFGPNGCGKSNIYKAIHLLTASADGKFSSYISDEGGLENIMWSGKSAPTARYPKRLQIACPEDPCPFGPRRGVVIGCRFYSEMLSR